MAVFLPVMTWHSLRDGLPNRTPTTPTVADVARMCQRGELAKIRGLGPRRLAAIEQCLACMQEHGQAGPRHVMIAVTLDDKLAAAAATITRIPEAKIRGRLEQLQTWQEQHADGL